MQFGGGGGVGCKSNGLLLRAKHGRVPLALLADFFHYVIRLILAVLYHSLNCLLHAFLFRCQGQRMVPFGLLPSHIFPYWSIPTLHMAGQQVHEGQASFLAQGSPHCI